jgi:hypothetical protein
MDNDFERYSVAIIIVFGAVIIGGLMAASISFGERNGFLFALGAATSAWLAGHALLFDRAYLYGTLVGIAVLMSVAATIVIAR